MQLFRRFPLRRIGGLACALAVLSPAPAAETTREPFAGVRYTHRTQTAPRPLSIHLVEIALDHPGIRFLITPGNGVAPGENTPATVRSFVSAAAAQIGINASFFLTSAAGTNFDNRGIVASRGDVYSPFDGDNRPWPVLNISESNFVQIVSQAVQPSTTTAVTPPVVLYNAVSGSERILTNGRITAGAVTYGEPTVLHPRTAVGITADRKLILLAVDGRQPGFSGGMLSSEVADLLLQLGVVDAVNLDGGGSTTLVFAEPTPRVLNRPSDGVERFVGASLAVFANPATGGGPDLAVWGDFYRNDPGGFTVSPGAAGNDAQALLAQSASSVEMGAPVGRRAWFQRLTLRVDPAARPLAANSPERWTLRHPWNPAAGGTWERPLRGRIGCWARTTSAGVRATVSVSVAGRPVRAVARALIDDGQWRLYEWDLQRTLDWETALAAADPLNAAFTLEALHFSGVADAVVDLDDVAHNALGSLALELEPLLGGHLANASFRTALTVAEPALHLGLSVAGPSDATKSLLLRAAGPALAAFGVAGVLADPRLTLFGAEGRVRMANDNWAGASAMAATAARLGAFPFSPASLDGAALATLEPGSHVWAVSGAPGGTGVVLAEIYDAGDRGTDRARLVNVGARGRVEAAGEPLVGGIVISGGPKRVLIRAVGPGLAAFGLGGLLADPQLLLFAGSTLHAINDDWGGGPALTEAFSWVGAFGLAAGSRDAALLVTLPPGVYSAWVRGAGSLAGAVLLEIYEVP